MELNKALEKNQYICFLNLKIENHLINQNLNEYHINRYNNCSIEPFYFIIF